MTIKHFQNTYNKTANHSSQSINIIKLKINNYQLKKKKKREMSDKAGMRNKTYRLVGGERGEVSLARRGGEASPARRKVKCRQCGGRRSIAGGRKSVTGAKKVKRC